MTIKSLTAVAIGALMLSPLAASADNVAASLSASFGTAPSGTVDVGATTFVTPQSLSVAASAGDRVVAGSAATAFSSGAAAGAGSSSDGVAPYASVTNNGGAYEVTVAFAEPGLFAELAALEAALQAQITANAGDISALQAAVAALETQVAQNSGDIAAIQADLDNVCNLVTLGFNGDTGTVEVDSTASVLTAVGTVSIFGTTVLFNPTFGNVQSTGSFTPTGEVTCVPA